MEKVIIKSRYISVNKKNHTTLISFHHAQQQPRFTAPIIIVWFPYLYLPTFHSLDIKKYTIKKEITGTISDSDKVIIVVE